MLCSKSKAQPNNDLLKPSKTDFLKEKFLVSNHFSVLHAAPKGLVQTAVQNQVVHHNEEGPIVIFHPLKQKLHGIKHQPSKATFPSQNHCP